MKATTNERMKTLHDKLEKYKDDILKEHAEGKSIIKLSREYDINAFTLGDWIHFWQTGIKRQRKNKQRIASRRRTTKIKRKFSQGLLNQMKINSEYNKRLIKRIKVDNGQDIKMIRYICGVKV